MFKGNDEQFLLRALAKNSVNLFLGAGFSRDAKNQLGSSMPTGWGLAKGIWNFLGYDGAYDDTHLDRMYAAMLSSGKKDREIQGFLESRFLCEWLPEEYSLLTKVYWHRIYTTNIDNVIEHAYLSSGGESKLEILSYPMDEMKERDQTLSKTQLIHLNGRLPCKPNQVTFSPRQYARRALYADPLYEGFHSDYVARSTIFIGTELNEPLFWQCIEARGARLKNDAERRKKSFLIAPEISQPQREVLKEYNVVPVEATAADFLNWIESKSTELPTRIMILRDIMPDIATVIEEVDLDRSERRARLELSKSFHSVPQVLPETSRPSLYLLGATPKWEDILANRDAPREITGAVREKVSVALKSNDEVSVFVLLGSAGCGKSTVLRRLGHDLASSGIRTLLTNSEEIPSSVQVAKALESYNEKTILLFDNSEGVLGAIPSLIEKLSKIDYPPILIIASRTNDFQRRIGRFSEHVDLHKIDVPNSTLSHSNFHPAAA